MQTSVWLALAALAGFGIGVVAGAYIERRQLWYWARMSGQLGYHLRVRGTVLSVFTRESINKLVTRLRRDKASSGRV